MTGMGRSCESGRSHRVGVIVKMGESPGSLGRGRMFGGRGG